MKRPASSEAKSTRPTGAANAASTARHPQEKDSVTAQLAELNAAKKEYKAGDSCELTVWRSGKELKLTVVFDEEPPQTETGDTPSGVLPPQGQQPSDGEGSEDAPDSWEDWLNSFFGRFYDYFGIQEEPQEEDGSESSGGSFRHFGG